MNVFIKYMIKQHNIIFTFNFVAYFCFFFFLPFGIIETRIITLIESIEFLQQVEKREKADMREKWRDYEK